MMMYTLTCFSAFVFKFIGRKILKGRFLPQGKIFQEMSTLTPPSEEFTSDTGEVKLSLGNTSSDEVVQLYSGSKELDDNA